MKPQTVVVTISGNLAHLRQRLDYQTFALAFLSLIASLVLGLANFATTGAIAERLAEDRKMTLAQVIPSTLHDNDLLQDSVTLDGIPIYIARKHGLVTGAAFQWTASGGYSGPIVLMVGVDRHGVLLGVRVIAHTETPGLGDKIEHGKSDWILGFAGRSLDNTPKASWRVKKDGGDFDQFSGATITPRAVVRSIENALQFFARHRETILSPHTHLHSQHEEKPS